MVIFNNQAMPLSQCYIVGVVQWAVHPEALHLLPPCSLLRFKKDMFDHICPSAWTKQWDDKITAWSSAICCHTCQAPSCVTEFKFAMAWLQGVCLLLILIGVLVPRNVLLESLFAIEGVQIQNTPFFFKFSTPLTIKVYKRCCVNSCLITPWFCEPWSQLAHQLRSLQLQVGVLFCSSVWTLMIRFVWYYILRFAQVFSVSLFHFKPLES